MKKDVNVAATRVEDLKAVEEHINRLTALISDDIDETRKKRSRLMAAGLDWDSEQLEVQNLEALHIVRTYDMRRERLRMEQIIHDFRERAPRSGSIMENARG